MLKIPKSKLGKRKSLTNNLKNKKKEVKLKVTTTSTPRAEVVLTQQVCSLSSSKSSTCPLPNVVVLNQNDIVVRRRYRTGRRTWSARL